ncbi:UNVERIFIED_CONTAM: hypothetical protein K2H54_019398 [Gekko kuhli]
MQESGLSKLPPGNISHLPQIILSEWISSLPIPESQPEAGLEICGPQGGDDHQSIRGQSEIIGWTTVETERKSKRAEVLCGKLSKSNRQPEPFISASSALHSEDLTCTQSPQKLIRTQGSPPSSGTEHPFNSDNGAEEGIVESETRASLEVTAGQQGGMVIFSFAEKQDNSQQTSGQGTGVHSADGQEALIPSGVIYGCETSMEKDEILVGLHSKNGVAEPQKREANQSLEEPPPALEDPSGVCTQVQRDVPGLYFPLQNQKSPMNKDVVEYDTESMQKPLELVCPLAGEDKINSESKPEDQQKECMSLDNTTLSSHEICKDTYRRLDNLEETIRELEVAISEISFPAPVEFMFPQQRSVDTEKEERKVGAGVSRCGRATLENMAFDCQMSLPQETSSGPPKSSPTSSKSSLLPKPQFLLSGNPQVQLFFIILLLSSTSRFLLQIFFALCPVKISSALKRQGVKPSGDWTLVSSKQ